MRVSLDWKVKVFGTGAPVKTWVCPGTSEIAELGLMVTAVGTTGGATAVGFPPPHEGRKTQPSSKNEREIAEKNFPIKSFAKDRRACSGKHSV
jgi:hypothetical protein